MGSQLFSDIDIHSNFTFARFRPQKVKELAENVVSTVKSGIFRMATGFIWGSPTTPTGASAAALISLFYSVVVMIVLFLDEL